MEERRFLFRKAAVTFSKVNNGAVPMSLEGTIVTVFVLAGCLIVVAGVVFMLEKKGRIGQFLKYILDMICYSLARSKHLRIANFAS